MPTNVPPQYKEAEARFRAASTNEEKVAALEEMLRIVPKHKGTDKLQADIKARLAKLRKQPRKKAGARSAGHMVPREGAGQIALAGPPNAGKSALVARATRAEPRVAEYPFTTREPVPGMMPHLDVALQLVDLPPISPEHVEPWVFDCIRRADLVWLVVHHAASLDGFEDTRELLEARHIRLVPLGRPGTGEAGDPDLARVDRRAIVVVTGADQPGSEENIAAFRELVESPDEDRSRIEWPTVAVSSVDGQGLEQLAAMSYEALGVIRIYTKQPGSPPDREKPFTVPRGSTVADLAAVIHKELAENLKFARLWGKSVFDGQRVQGEHALEDGDVIEIHI